MRFKVLARIAAVRRYFAAERAPDLALTGALGVAAGQAVQVVRVPHYDLVGT